MTKDNKISNLPLVPEGIAREEMESGPVLIGGHCPDCGRNFFPRPRYCPKCLRPPQERKLGGDGVIYSYTVVRTKPPFGLPQPYALAFIDLAQSGLRIFGMLNPADIERLAIGRRVRLETGPMGHDGKGQPCLRPFFSLQGKEGEDG
jgi:uncharacterized OB-fold protein